MASPGFSLVRMRAPIARPLTGVVIIMCYLAAMALASVVGVGRWAYSWQTEASTKMSVYIPPAEKEIFIGSRGKKIKTLLGVLKKEKIIDHVHLLSKKEISSLLAPWVGKNMDLSRLPLMDVIDVTLVSEATVDEEALRQKITAIIPQAELENHQQWRVAIERWVLFVQLLAGLLLLAALACMMAVISLAAHATIDANRAIVSIFHLIGSEDNFVIHVFRRYFLRLGLVAGFVGAAGAVLTFLLAEQLWQFVPPALKLSAIGLSLHTIDYSILLLIPLLACLIAVTASRRQARAHLARLP